MDFGIGGDPTLGFSAEYPWVAGMEPPPYPTVTPTTTWQSGAAAGTAATLRAELELGKLTHHGGLVSLPVTTLRGG